MSNEIERLKVEFKSIDEQPWRKRPLSIVHFNGFVNEMIL